MNRICRKHKGGYHIYQSVLDLLEVDNREFLVELGVSSDFRHRGIGSSLIKMSIDSSPKLFLRTSADNNDKVINMYKRFGFYTTDVFEEVEHQDINGSVSLNERLYMKN
jgi:ribosomal protein S18 acetylase RimI-like enzyme